MRTRALVATIAAAGMIALSGVALAQTQTPQIRTPNTVPQVQPQGGRLTARAADLLPIPSRIEHMAVSVRNAGSAASGPSIATVNCHLPGQEGGCPEIPAAALAAYTNPAYPNRLVIDIPAIEAGHVHTHYLSFANDISFPTGSYVFEIVVDAGSAVAETNEGNNAGEHTWVVP